jgi:hypothetical protein
VVVSDYDDSELRQAALLAGASEYRLKDNLPDLVRLVDTTADNPQPQS